MRIGSALIFLVISWIGLGYLLSDDINTRNTLTQLQQQLNLVVEQRNTLQSQMESINSENARLKDENAQLIEQVTRLQEYTNQLQSKNDRLEQLYSNLQAEFDKSKKLASFVDLFAEMFGQAPLLALIIPVLPTSLVAGYVVYQHNKHHSGQSGLKHVRLNRIYTINVTKDEMRQIEKARRGSAIDS